MATILTTRKIAIALTIFIAMAAVVDIDAACSSQFNGRLAIGATHDTPLEYGLNRVPSAHDDCRDVLAYDDTVDSEYLRSLLRDLAISNFTADVTSSASSTATSQFLTVKLQV